VKVHPYEMAVQGIGPDHPIDHDVNIEHLSDPLRAVAETAIEADHLSCYTALDRARWVSRAQLAGVAGFGRKLYEPASPFFVPERAMMKVPYRPDPVTEAVAATSWYQRRVLSTAQHTADYLSALRAAMPPRPYDIHVHRTEEVVSPILALVLAEAIRTHPSDSGWWVVAVEVREVMPLGEKLDDLSSAWYVDVHDWADHEEVDRLSTEHRNCWPEIYDAPIRSGGPRPCRHLCKGRDYRQRKCLKTEALSRPKIAVGGVQTRRPPPARSGHHRGEVPCWNNDCFAGLRASNIGLDTGQWIDRARRERQNATLEYLRFDEIDRQQSVD
jgi:hypothetical protein